MTEQETDAARNGMTEAGWLALSPDARTWRSEHPRIDPPAPVAAARPASLPVASMTGGRGSQVVLTGAAQAAARGGTHASIAENTAARDAAIVAGHVEHGTPVAAVQDVVGAGVVAAPLAPAVKS